MNVDFLVIGSGPAGQKAAIQAAKLGRSVALVERKALIGGVTVNTGTIPSKTLREAVLYFTGWRERSFYGRGHRLKKHVTFQDLTERLQITIRHETEVIQDQLVRNGVEVIAGHASFQGPHEVLVDHTDGRQSVMHAGKILIATGTRPVRPAGIPFDGRRVIDSDGLLLLQDLPRSMTVVGGGVIGVEYATIFSALDIKVSIVDGREQMLGFLDKEIVADLDYHLRERGVVMRLGEKLVSVELDGTGHVVTRLESGKRLRSDVVLFAAGREGSTDSLRLETAGLQACSRGLLEVDAHFRTSVPHIYAAGDVIGFPSLASTSMEQGRLAACHAFGRDTASFPEHFPFGIYAVPEISMVGKTEQELVKEGVPYEVGVARLRETARGQILGLERGVLKIIFSLETRKVLGVHILGEQATELIHIGQAALALGGTLEYFVENVFNYPTLAEAYKVAALDAWNRMCPDPPAVLDQLAEAERAIVQSEPEPEPTRELARGAAPA